MHLPPTAAPSGALASFLDLSPDAVVVVDGRGAIVALNEAMTTLTGYAADELVGQTIEALVPERLRTRHAQTRMDFTSSPSVRPMGLGRDLWLRTVHGTEVAVDIALRPMETDGGRLVAAVIRDVTAARATQIRLERAEAQMRGMVEAFQDGIAVLHAIRDDKGEVTDLVIEFANAAAAAILDLPINRLVGLGVWSVLDHSDEEFETRFMDYRELLRTGTPVTHEAPWSDPVTGEQRALLEIKAALAGPDRVVVAFRNVLEQRAAQQRIREMNDELRAAAQFQRDFISASSHELRTPLTAMTGFAELLVERWDNLDADQRRHAADAILRNARRQLQLVDDLAHAAHLQSGRLVLSPTTFSIDDAVREALASVVGAEDVEQPSPTGLQVSADEGRVIQVVINMVTNGLRYGAAPYRVEVSEGADPAVVELSVTDAGSGVPEHFQAQLFDAFAQASKGERREAQGTGLGLYISKNLAIAMGGDLVYEDAPGGGARFVLTLPRAA